MVQSWGDLHDGTMTNTTPPDEPANEASSANEPPPEPTWPDVTPAPDSEAQNDVDDAPFDVAEVDDAPTDTPSLSSEITDERDEDLEERIAAAVADEPEAARADSGPVDSDPVDFGPPPPLAGPPPGAGAPPYRRLYRSADRKVGGVAGGIAAFTGVDPTIVRLATLLAAFTGVGLLIYIAAWWIVPEAPAGHHAIARQPTPTADRTLSMALGVAAITLAIGVISGSWAIFAIALIGAGIWLLSDQNALSRLDAAAPSSGAHSAAPAETAYRRSAPGADAYGSTGWGTYDAGPPPPLTVAPPESPAPPRRTQRVTWIVLSIVALIGAVAIAASAGDLWNVSATRTLGLAVVVIGVGVVAGVVRGGGARGLIPLGILATIALFPVSALDGVIGDGIGSESFRPQDLATLETSYRHGIGELVVDLSRVDLDGTRQTIDIDLGIGELIVIVPNDVGGTAELSAKAGEVVYSLPGSRGSQYDEGIQVDSGQVRLAGENGELILDIDVGFGVAELRQARN